MIPGMPFGLSDAGQTYPTAQGQVVFDELATGTMAWTVPSLVTSLCAVCVGQGGAGTTQTSSEVQGGGGALAYVNDVAVTPGETLTIEKTSDGVYALKRGTTTLCLADSGKSAGSASPGQGGQAASSVGDVTQSGGDGTIYGAGGAAGYSGAGGAGAGAYTIDGAAGSGGGGGGGASKAQATTERGAGGGVGVLGEGASGDGGSHETLQASPSRYGKGGSGGTDGSASSGGSYGGGGGHHEGATTPGPGAVRIIWGPDRSYPNNAEDV